jgi:acyl carrier protein
LKPETIVATTFNCDEDLIDDRSSPETIEEWDSLGHITLMIELEAAYGVSFSPDEAIGLTSISAIKSALSAHHVTW